VAGAHLLPPGGPALPVLRHPDADGHRRRDGRGSRGGGPGLVRPASGAADGRCARSGGPDAAPSPDGPHRAGRPGPAPPPAAIPGLSTRRHRPAIGVPGPPGLRTVRRPASRAPRPAGCAPRTPG
jgi:hypothetical protein